MKSFENIKYGPLEPQHLNIYLPDNDPCDLVIWFHGGGLESGDSYKQDFMTELNEHGIGVVSAEYRMYPSAHFPEYVFDAALAVKYVLDHIKEYTGVKRTYISGQSAGAYITSLLCVNPAYLRNVKVDPMTIDGFISDSSQMTVHYNVLRERGFDSRIERIDEAAPLYFIDQDLKFTRLLLISYEQDIPCRPEQNLLMYTAIKRLMPDADVEYVTLPGGHCHGSSERNEKGTFDYVDQVVRFLGE